MALPWRVTFDPKAGVHRHATAPDFGHAFLAPLIENSFEFIGIPVTLWNGREWLPIHEESTTVTRFEYDHRLGAERAHYNERCLKEVRRSRKTVRGEYAGYSDLFVPVTVRRQVLAVLVAGPFQLARPTSTEILARWRYLSGHQGHPGDPEFAWYLRETLRTLVLDERRASSLERLLECFASLMAGEGAADALMNQAVVLRVELEGARFVDRVWGTVKAMTDDRSLSGLYSEAHSFELRKLGVTRVADHVLVGLTRSRSRGVDPVDEAVRRDGFQRASVDLARGMGNVLAGQVGDHGVLFISGANGSMVRRRQKVVDLVDRALSLAHRRFDLDLYFGSSPASEAISLARSYQTALAAAESALSEGRRLVHAERIASHPARSLKHLRDGLAGVVDLNPELMAARFEGYLETVAIHSGYRVDSARDHLEVGFERMTQALLARGALDEKSFAEMQHSLDLAATGARTIDELFAAYRQGVADVTAAVQNPRPAHQDRSLRRALEYIRQHYAEPIRLGDVAKVAGFTPSHFSKLFILREQTPFERYVMSLRIERARQLLTATNIEIARVAELSGFASAQYFCRVFRRAVRTTPHEYRERQAKRAGIKLPIQTG